MKDSDDKTLRDEFGKLLDDLGRLGDSIQRQRYPGLAWPAAPAPGRRTNRWVRPAVAAAAAAAVVMAALLGWLILRDGAGPKAPLPPDRIASRPAEEGPFWSVPTDVGRSLRAGASVRIPSVNISLSGQAGALEWKVPAVSLWPPEQRSNKDGT